MRMIVDIKTGSPYSEIPIKKGEKELSCNLGLEREDYGISAFASWDTTISSVEKTKKGFQIEIRQRMSRKRWKTIPKYS